MTSPRPSVLRLSLAALALTAAGSAVLIAQNSKDIEAKRPRMSLRAQPVVSIAPARVVLTAEITGGPDDFEEYYCPTVEWEWGDGTTSESSADCAPYEAGKSVIKRRYTIQHVFRRDGATKVYFHLKRKDKIVGSASTVIQVQPGGPTSY